MGTKEEGIFEHWEKCHKNELNNSHFFLSGFKLNDYLSFFNAKKKYTESKNIVEVGVGEGCALKKMNDDGKIVYAVDISPSALEKYKSYTKGGIFTLDDLQNIPKNSIDIIFCHLVVQHIDDDMLKHHLKFLIPCLNNEGIYCIQYRGKVSNLGDKSYKNYMYGDVERSPEEINTYINECGGEVVEDIEIKKGNYIEKRYHPWNWRMVKIKKSETLI